VRRWFSIAWATALELLSEPLSLLLLLAALALAVLAPALHYHQFGEVTRMARDAGLSALLTCGTVFAVFGSIRAFRGEIESGTLSMALAHPVSRGEFLLAKTLGVAAAYAVFALIVTATALTMVNGAAIGGVVADQTGDVARLWGPSFALGVVTAVVPLVLAAGLNRFARVRFVPACFRTALALSLLGVLYRPDLSRALQIVPAAALLAVFTLVFIAAAAAFAVKWPTNVATMATVGTLAVAVPAVGNYYLADALGKGASIPPAYLACALAAAVPAVVAFLLLGILFFNGRDVA